MRCLATVSVPHPAPNFDHALEESVRRIMDETDREMQRRREDAAELSPQSRPRSRWPWWAVGGGAGVLLLGILLTVLLLRPPSGRPINTFHEYQACKVGEVITVRG